MREPCAASWPCADRQSGAAILLAILTVALVAGVAAAVIADHGRAVASTSGRHDQAQARLLARGAVDWARNILAADAHASAIDHEGEAWATRVPPTPADEGGEVGGDLADLSGHFDLNSLAKNGGVDERQSARYRRLLILLGVPEDRAAALTLALIDWLDADDLAAGDGQSEIGQYAAYAADAAAAPARRPANGPLVDVDELALVHGYDLPLVARLRPFIVALPVAAPINVNTAPAEVLAAVLDGPGAEKASLIVGARRQAPFKDVADFLARAGLADAGAGTNRLAATSRYFMASVRARYGEATTQLQVMLDRQGAWPDIVWQKIQ